MAYVAASHTPSSNLCDKDEEKLCELDLVPTKISTVEPDPHLYVTPEKKSLLKELRKKKEPAVVDRTNSSLLPDPELMITPEKYPSALKTFKKSVNNPIGAKNKVRFNIPDSSEDNTTLSLSPSGQSVGNQSSTLTTDYEDSSSLTTTDDALGFATKAALYTQRNPLAEITLDSHLNFDSSTSIGSASSSSSNTQRSFSKLYDMKGKKFTQKQASVGVIEPVKCDTVTKITTAKRSVGHRKSTPVQVKIDKLTSDETSNRTVSPDGNVVKKETYLKKKSGLHKHQHSVKYLNKEKAVVLTNNFESPKYHTSLALGQKLQQIKEEKFDAMKTLTKKLDDDKELKVLVDAKAASGTNVDPEESLYTDLISVDVAPQDILTTSEFRRVKRPPVAKTSSPEEPNIMDAFPWDLIQEKLVLDSRCYTLPDMCLVQSPLLSVMSLYQHSLSWS